VLEPNDDVYDGERKAGEKDGRGTMQYASGAMYTGEWAAGLREGSGTYTHASGDRYTGGYLADKKHGRGVFKYTDGAEYDGDWSDGKMEGPGTSDQRAPNSQSRGPARPSLLGAGDGRLAPRCRYRFASGNVYEGEFKAGERGGRGTFTYADGEAEVGTFTPGAMVGEGVAFSADRRQALILTPSAQRTGGRRARGRSQLGVCDGSVTTPADGRPFCSPTARSRWRWRSPCCAVPCRAVLCCAVLCCAVLCCAVLSCAVLCCAVLCCAVS
jgi:hypothetical protein